MTHVMVPYTWINGKLGDVTLVTLVVNHLPAWFASGDLVIRRGTRLFARSLTQTEPRYRQAIRRLVRLIRTFEKSRTIAAC